MGIITKGMGIIMSKFSKKIPQKKVIAATDDGGPYVRKQQHNAKKAKKEGAVTNKSGHVTIKKIGAGTVGAIGTSAVYGKVKKNKKKKDKK